MSTLPIAPRGIVVSIWGKAYVRGANGQWRPLKLGEVVEPQAPLRTEQDAIVLMVDAAGQVQRLAGPTATEADRVIAALDSADPQAAPAAGLAAGDSGGLQAGLRVERVAESTTTLPLASTAASATSNLVRPAQSDAPELSLGAPVTASSSSIAAVEEGSAIALGLSAPGGSGALQIVVTQVPSIGRIVTAAGDVIAAGSTLSPSDLAGLRYLPPADYDGVTPITPFAYSVSNGTSTASGGTQISLTAINDAPVANADSISTVGTAPATHAVLDNDTDVDGGPLVVTSASVAPALGTVVINVDGTLTFTAAPGVNGAVPVTYTISDGRGGTASAILTVNVALLPGVSVDVPALSNDSTPRINGTSNLPAGSTVTLSVTDAAGAVQTFTASVLPDGSYAVDVPSALADGPYTVVASVSTPAGSASATDGGSIDTLAPTLTVDGPALTNDTTPTITGTTDLPAGATVWLTVTDALGAVQTFAATVQAGGTYSADVPAPLAQGNYMVVAAAADAAGNAASASGNGAIDSVAPTLTVDAPATGQDITPTITGTTDLPPGATITLTVTDALGAVQTFTTSVQAGGLYSADVPSALAEGTYTVLASATDAAGNAASANDSGVIDVTAPTLTVDAPALTNDTTPTITGTTDLLAGATITLTVTDALGAVQTFTATVQAGGTYSADVPAALAEGGYTVLAAASDAAGNAASANDSGAVDITPPAASVSLDPITADNIVNADEATASVLLTGSVGGDVQAGDTVALVVNGNTYTGAVQPGNTFSIAVAGADLLADADRRIDASVATTDAAGNTGTATAVRDYAVNTAPVAVADTFSISEDSAGAGADVTPGTPGQDSDADGDALTVTGVAVGVQTSTTGNVGSALAGTWGTLTLAADGSFNYVPLPVAQTLAAGQTESDVFSYTIADGRGGFATATLTVSVTGAEDPTVIAGPLTGTVQEDVSASAVGALSATDPETGARAFVVQTGTAGTYGQFSIDALGNWSYALTNAQANVQALAEGQSVAESFIVASDDGTTATVVVTVLGSNDTPVVSSSAISASEEGAPVALGLAAPTDVDAGTTLTITVSGLPMIGQVQLADATPVLAGATLSAAQLVGLRYLAPADYDGVSAVGSFAYSVSDGLVSEVGFTSIALAAVNDAPVAVAVSATGAEDATSIAITLSATDVDSTIASYTVAALPANGTLYTDAALTSLVVAGTPFTGATLYFVPAADFNGLVSFDYAASDGLLSSNTAAATITVTPVNDAPVAVNGATTTGENTSLTTSVPAATDIDGTIASYSLATGLGAGNGSLVFNPDGSYTFTPGTDFDALAVGASRDVSFTYTATDDLGATSAPATVTITVTGTNDAPVALPVSGGGLEDSATRIAVALSGSDVDGSVVSYRITSLPANGSLYAAATGGAPLAVGAVVTGPVYLTTTLNFNGSTSFGYSVTDNNGAVSGNTATATITITPVNDAPTLTGVRASFTYTESAGAGITRTLIDTSVVFTDVDSPNLAGGSLTVAIANVVANQDLLDIRNQGTGVGRISVVGTDVRYNFGSGAVSIGTLSGGTGVAPLVVSFNANATPVAVDALIQNVRYGNAAQLPDTTPRAVSFTVVDGDGTANGGADTVVVNVTINVVSTNDAPRFAALGGSVSHTEGGAPVVLDSNATLNDPELGSGFIGSLNNLGGATLTLARSGGANLQDQFSGSGTLTLSAGNVVLGGVTVGTYSPAVLAAGTLAITFSSGTTVAQGNSVLQRISYANSSDTPPASAVISFTFSDGNTGAQGSGGARSATGSVTVNITAVNDAPVAAAVSASGAEDAASIAITLSATDVDSTIASYTVAALPSNGTLYTNAGLTTAVVAGTPFTGATLYFVPAADFNGLVSFNYTASDGSLSSNVAAASITVTAVNDAPINTVPGAQTTAEDTPRAITGLAISDVDAGTSSMTVTLAVTNGTLTVSGGTAGIAGSGTSTVTLTGTVTQINATLAATVTYVPTADYFGAATLTVTTSDNGNSGAGGALTDIDTVAITVTAVNDAPVAVAVSASGAEDAASIAITLSASDVDSAIASYTVAALPSNGALYTDAALTSAVVAGSPFSGATLYFVPAADFNGLVSFNYTASDGLLVSNTATASITVTPVNDAPVAADDGSAAAPFLTVAEDSGPSSPIAVLSNDTDIDGDTLTVTAASSPNGTVTINADNTLVFTPAANFFGPTTISYTVSDGNGGTDTASVFVNVTAVNDAPVANDDGLAATEDAPVTYTAAQLLGNDVDVDLDTLTIASVTSGAGGTAVLNGDGTVTFTPNANFNGAADFTYTVTDGALTSNTATVSVTVAAVNDAPINTTPSAQTTDENTALQISGLAIADVDAVTGSMTVTLAVTNGALDVSGGGATIAGSGTSTVTLTGTVAQINATLSASVSYAPSVGFSGASTLTMTTSDNGNSGAGGALTDTDTLDITVTPAAPVNSTPIAVADTASLLENAVVTRTAATGVLANDTDADAGDTKIVSAVSFGATAGTVGAALDGVYGTLTLNADGSYSYSANRPAADALALDEVVVETFSYTMVDSAGAASSTTVSFTITGTNDAAVITGTATASLTETDAVLSTGGSLSATDVDSPATFVAQTGVAGNNGFGTFSIDAAGVWTYTTTSARDEFVAGTTYTDSITVATADGTTQLITVSILGTNDAPAVGSASVRISEEGLVGANPDALGASDTTNATSASGTIAVSDIDSALLNVTFDLPSATLTSGGTPITWARSTGDKTLTGSAGANTVITATIDNSGNYSVTLLGPVDHADPASEDVRSFAISVRVSDGSLSSIGTLTVGIEDDSPIIGTPASAILFNGLGTVAVGDLHLSIGADAGAGARAVFTGTTVDAGGFITGTSFNASGAVVSSGYHLTYNGSRLTYTSNGDGSLSAVDQNNVTVFTASADSASGLYTVTMLRPLDQAQLTSSTFGGVSGGNNGTYLFSDGTTTFNLVATGYVGTTLSTVNTSANNFGVANQAIDTGERLVFAFAGAGSGSPSRMTGIRVTAENLGNGESLTWRAYDAAGALVGSGTVAGSGGGNGSDVVVNLTTANFTNGAFSSIEFGAGTGSTYKLALNSITGGSEFLNQTTGLAVRGVDADGDVSATQPLSLTFNAGGTLTGTGAEDALAGGPSADTLTGGAGNDILVGGAGNDVLTGGAGADTFRWHFADRGSLGAPAIDRITDFNSESPTSGNGDVLDLRDLLQGETTSVTLDRYLDFNVSGGNTEIRISSSGGFTGGAYASGVEDQRIVLDGVDIRATLGLTGTATDSQIIAELINRGKLVTDVPPGG